MDSRSSFNISNNVAHANSQQIITTYYDARGHNASVQACLRTLDCSDVDAVRTEIHSHDGVIPECIEWIFQDERFRQWKEQKGNAILWIYGSPGKGKTRMAAGIVDKLRKETGSPSVNGLTGFFFCRSTDDRMNNAVDVLKGIIRTIWEQRHSLKEHLHHHWIDEEQKFDKDLNQVASLWSLLEKMTKDIGHQATYVVIDAIDECSEQVEHLLRLIHTAGLVSPPNIKWLITSRPSSLDLQGSVWSYHRPMQIDLDSFTVQVDDAVKRYIKVKTAWMELSRFSVDDQAHICKLLLTRSESTFLWVAFVCQEVRNLPASEVIRMISAMPKGLHRLYEKNMQLLDEACHDSNEFAIDYRKLVWTLYNLSGSPHLLELAVLAGLPTEKASDESYLIRVIRECNTFMVLTDSDAVMLVHKSVNDYLDELQSTRSQLVKSPRHGTLARRCIQILRRSLHRNLTELRELDSEAKEADLELRKKFSSIAGYSCVHWIEHVVKDRISSPITINIFLRRHLSHWLEAITISGRCMTCLDHLIQLDTVLKAISYNPSATPSNASPSKVHMKMAGLHESVRSARDFVATSRNVIERWPLQVYLSALIFFAPKDNINGVSDVGLPDWVLGRMMRNHHSWYPSPSMTHEHDHAETPQIALSNSGEHLITSSSGKLGVWRLLEPIRCIELTCDMLQADLRPPYGLKIMIEGNQVKASWVDKHVRRTPIIRWATWNLDSEEPTGEGFHPVAAAAIDDQLRLRAFGHLVGSEISGASEPSKLTNSADGPGQSSCVSSHGKLFANIDKDVGRIRIFSIADGEELPAVIIQKPLSDAGFVDDSSNPFLTELRFCCDDKMIIYAAHNKTKTFFVMCNLGTSKVVVRSIELDDVRDFLDCTWAMDKDGAHIACVTGCDIYVLECVTNRILQKISAFGLQNLALSTMPLRVAAVANDGTVRIWNVDEAVQSDCIKEVHDLPSADVSVIKRGRPYLVTDWLPSPDNKKVFSMCTHDGPTGCDKQMLAIEDADQGITIGSGGLGSIAVLANAFSADSALLALCYSHDIPLEYVESGDDYLDTIGSSLRPPEIPKLYLAVHTVPGIHTDPLWKLDKDFWIMQMRQVPIMWPSSVAITFSEDQSRLLYSVGNGPCITVGTITISDHQETGFILDWPDFHLTTRIDSSPHAICASADHSLVALSCSLRTPGPNKFRIWISKDRKVHCSGKGFAEGVKLLRFSASAELRAALSENGHIRVFRVPKNLSASSAENPNSLQFFDIVNKFLDQRRIINIEFTKDGRRLKINLGEVDIFSDIDFFSDFGREVVLAIPGPYIDKNWISVEGKRLVYLPPECRPSMCKNQHGFIVQDSCVWIMSLTRGIQKIEFDLELIYKLIRDGKFV